MCEVLNEVCIDRRREATVSQTVTDQLPVPQPLVLLVGQSPDAGQFGEQSSCIVGVEAITLGEAV